MRIAVAALLVLMVAAPLTAPAEVFRCVNASGRVEFTQVRPKDGNCGAVAPPAAPVGDAGESLKAYSETIDESRKNEAREKRAADRAKEDRNRRCADARRRQGILDRFGSRIVRFDDKGQRHDMTDEQYQNERKSVEADLRSYCS